MDLHLIATIACWTLLVLAVIRIVFVIATKASAESFIPPVFCCAFALLGLVWLG